MDFQYEFKNQKLKKMVETKAKELEMDMNELIWGYINRGLMSDGLNGDVFRELHSEEYLAKINKALGVD